jgi:hypothetical protein
MRRDRLLDFRPLLRRQRAAHGAAARRQFDAGPGGDAPDRGVAPRAFAFARDQRCVRRFLGFNRRFDFVSNCRRPLWGMSRSR